MAAFLVVMLLTSGGSGTRKNEVLSMTNARNLCLVCRQYARDHGGVFPPALDALFPKYITDRSVLASPLSPGEPIGYTYTFPGPGKTDSPDTIVLEDKFSPALAHVRIVVYANGSARALNIP
jgi:hypothetical protein